MLIYIHVPFCVSKCSYCAFYSLPLYKGNMDIMQEYLDTLFMEIALAGEKYKKRSVQSIFFGGGTPSILPPAIINAILSRISGTFKFGVKPEITLEANPESLKTPNIFRDLLGAGINRLSIGAQSMTDELLKTLGRPHKAQDVVQSVMGAKAAGFTNVGTDLIWGIPGQSIKEWLNTVKEITQLAPEHISAYSLTLESGTDMEKMVSSGRLNLPPERDQSLMFMEGGALLESSGYLHYEISNFAKMGFQSRHNMGYWEGRDYLAFGPAATSTIGNKRWSSPANFSLWKNFVTSGKIGENPEILTPKTRILELVMLRLRTARGLRLKAYTDLTGRDFIKDHNKIIQAMHDNGLIRIRNGYLSLTRTGMLVSNAIISNLFEELNKNLDQRVSSTSTPEKNRQQVMEAEVKPVLWPKVNNN